MPSDMRHIKLNTMQYLITGNEIRQFYNNRFLTVNKTESFSSRNYKIDMDVFNMSVTEWSTQQIKAHWIKTKAKRNIQINGGVNGDFIILHFVCEGETDIGNNNSYKNSSKIKRNGNNMFNSNPGNIKHSFGKNGNNTYFKVFLPYSYIKAKAEQYPDIFGPLSMIIKNQCPVLKEGNLVTTIEMKTVIEQIKKSGDMGNLAPFYFETKIQELLILQLRQMDKYNCPECKYYRNYKEQLNEARNFIETNYRTPPTIASLARHVGMSETVLKTNFKSCFDTTIYGYLFNYRMNIAKKFLGDSSLTIAEIGEKTGYEHPSHFTTAFKRKYGISPAEFRNHNK